jgi:hypothetical protein
MTFVVQDFIHHILVGSGCPCKAESETIHDYKLLELSNMSMIRALCESHENSSWSAEVQRRLHEKVKYGIMSIYSLDHLTYVAYGPRSYYIKYTGPCSDPDLALAYVAERLLL